MKKIETRDSIIKRQQAVINEFTPKIIDWYKNGMAIQKIYDAIKKEGHTIGYETISTILKNNNIQANLNAHKGLSELSSKATQLPFEDEDELPEVVLKRVK